MFNISGVELTRNERKVLDKGLKFAPKRNLNIFDTYIDIQRYTRKLNIQKYFLNKPELMSRWRPNKRNNLVIRPADKGGAL